MDDENVLCTFRITSIVEIHSLTSCNFLKKFLGEICYFDIMLFQDESSRLCFINDAIVALERPWCNY
jgi:hypothetical protein